MSNNNQSQANQTRDFSFVVAVRIRDEFELDLAEFESTIKALESELVELENHYDSFTTRNSIVNSIGR